MTFDDSSSVTRQSRPVIGRSAGMIAIGELMIVIVSLTSFFWLGSQLWPMIGGELQQSEFVLRGNSERSVYRLSLDRDGQRMWVYRPHEGLLRLNLATGTLEQSIPLSGMELSALAHSSDGACSLLCGQDNFMVWIRDGQDVLLGQSASRNELIVDATVSCDGGMALCVTSGGSVRGWYDRGAAMKEIRYELTLDSTVLRMGLSNSGRRLCIMRSDGVVSFHDPTTGDQENDVLKSDSASNEFAWSDDDSTLAIVDSRGTICVYDACSLTCLWKTQVDVNSTCPYSTAIVLSPDRRWLAAAFNCSNEIFVFAVGTRDSGLRLQGHEGIVRTLQFSPDSRSLYSGSFDGTIREWTSKTWTELRVVD